MSDLEKRSWELANQFGWDEPQRLETLTALKKAFDDGNFKGRKDQAFYHKVLASQQD